MQQIPIIREYQGTVPDSSTQEPVEFSNNVGEYLGYFDTDFTPDANESFSTINNVSSGIDDAVLTVEGFSSYKGDYDTGTTYNKPNTVTSSGIDYICRGDDVLNQAPENFPGLWMQVVTGITDIVKDTNPSLGGDLNALGGKVHNVTVSTTTGLSLPLNTSNILIAELTVDSTIVFSNIKEEGFTQWYVIIASEGYTALWDDRVSWDDGDTEPSWSTTKSDLAYFYTTDGGATIKGMRIAKGYTNV